MMSSIKKARIILVCLPMVLLTWGKVQAKEKYVIGLFHFNFQYVAGDYKIERRIIRESLFPVLQFFDAHPQYKSDIEMQGYAIEVLAQEHPDVLALLQKLVRRRQIELVVAHYSDQLFIGYPAADLQRSIELSDEVLARYGLERSRVFFGQEFQWSPALASVLKGKYDVAVTSSDPNSWYNGETLPLVKAPYGSDTILALIGGGRKELKGMRWDIAFLDDGEEFNTLDYNSNFFRVSAQEDSSKGRYLRLQKEGYKFVTITELTERIKADRDYHAPVYPFVPEGTWHMNVCGPFMWMGRQRSGVETDGVTRSLSYQLRGEVMMVEKLLEYAVRQGKDVSGLREWLKEAWKHLLLSEVSDSSGWDPWLVEVQYTDNEVAAARKFLKMILTQLWKLLAANGGGGRWVVETGTGAVTAGPVAESETSAGGEISSAGQPVAWPIPFSVRAASYTVRSCKLNDSLYRMDIVCTRPSDGAVEIAFETGPAGLEYSASCGESASVVIPAGYAHDPTFALTNGFVYLNNGYSLVKDCTVEHLAATWRRSTRQMVFREELKEGNMEMRMRFYLVRGVSLSGLRFANGLNTWPSYRVEGGPGGVSYGRISP
ncbi:MAG: hypothetical protein J0H07_02015 [Sphingobacteriales bacterium]|nr:hypothetical protein [Sphingobacteriales bacterium]